MEPLYNEVLGTMKITLLYQVSHYIRVIRQRNIKSWDQQNYLVIRGFCYIRPRYNEVPLSLYADDTYMYVASKDPAQLEAKLNKDLESMRKWYSHNELLLNAKKCKLILFATKNNLVKLHIDGCKLDIVDEFKYI